MVFDAKDKGFVAVSPVTQNLHLSRAADWYLLRTSWNRKSTYLSGKAVSFLRAILQQENEWKSEQNKIKRIKKK